MDGIQPYPGSPGAAPAPSYPAPSGHPQTHPPHHLPHAAGAAKSPADYARAVGRQGWLVLTVALAVSVFGSLVVLKMKAVYRSEAEITIRPPEYDAVLARLVSNENLARVDKDANATYVPDRLAYLRSPSLIGRVLRDPRVSGPKGPADIREAIEELKESLATRNYTGTSYFKVTLEGNDPAKTARTLRVLLDQFGKDADDESRGVIEQSKLQAGASLTQLSNELKRLDQEIYDLGRSALALALGGKSVLQDRYDQMAATLMHKRVGYDELQRRIQFESLKPKTTERRVDHGRAQRLADLDENDRMLRNRLAHIKRSVRGAYYNDDPTVRYIASQLQQVREARAAVEAETTQEEAAEAPGEAAAESILAAARAEIDTYQEEQVKILKQLQESAPDYSRYMTLMRSREQKEKQIGEIQAKLSEFDMLAKTQKPPVTITVAASEPTLPVRPKRSISIALCVILGLGMGIGLACLREHLDHSVKAPEHLTTGLALSLLGVVPRIRRGSRNTRGGHLWTPGIPDSAAADAYRNIRAGLLGVARAKGPIVTLLVTSAKAGEGKSTTALNLAATCARAGERTLLVDIDLRRPSLNDVFPHEENHLGLVDVLRGEMPWQRTVVPSDLPNLDFLPTGDSREIPIEILGSLELRQLLKSLASNHYDRVILDGPAVLGLADCRVLGEIVDAAILVVRSGSADLPPIHRAKSTLEQSHVRLAGLVFNGLTEDIESWSSYGPGPGAGDGVVSVRRVEAAGAIAS